MSTLIFLRITVTFLVFIPPASSMFWAMFCTIVTVSLVFTSFVVVISTVVVVISAVLVTLGTFVVSSLAILFFLVFAMLFLFLIILSPSSWPFCPLPSLTFSVLFHIILVTLLVVPSTVLVVAIPVFTIPLLIPSLIELLLWLNTLFLLNRYPLIFPFLLGLSFHRFILLSFDSDLLHYFFVLFLFRLFLFFKDFFFFLNIVFNWRFFLFTIKSSLLTLRIPCFGVMRLLVTLVIGIKINDNRLFRNSLRKEVSHLLCKNSLVLKDTVYLAYRILAI